MTCRGCGLDISPTPWGGPKWAYRVEVRRQPGVTEALHFHERHCLLLWLEAEGIVQPAAVRWP